MRTKKSGKRGVLVMLLMACLAAGVAGFAAVRVAADFFVPDPAKCVRRAMTQADLAYLNNIEGKRRYEVLWALGHPRAVEREGGGREVWSYPWAAVCLVSFKDGVATGSYITDGY